MNIFVLDKSISKSVESYIDKHVLKMILESGQMLCMANSVLKSVGYLPRKLENVEQNEVMEFSEQFKGMEVGNRAIPYLPIKSHLNHPCTIWARTSRSNWEYLFDLIKRINEEYMYRYESNSEHKTYENLKNLMPPSNLKDKGLKIPPLAMPDEYKEKSVVESYRSYYRNEKEEIAEWTKRDKPLWF